MRASRQRAGNHGLRYPISFSDHPRQHSWHTVSSGKESQVWASSHETFRRGLIMQSVRIIPCLLLKGTGLVKTRLFRDPTYIGDPCNAVKIFNDKEVDELILLDIDATPQRQLPKFDLVRDIVSEAFMPVAYGGGIRTGGGG